MADEPSYKVELIDSAELAKRLGVPVSWVRDHVRARYGESRIPHLKLGDHLRFEWGSPQFLAWLDSCRRGGR